MGEVADMGRECEVALLWSRSRTFLLEPEPVIKLQLRADAVWLRGTVKAK